MNISKGKLYYNKTLLGMTELVPYILIGDVGFGLQKKKIKKEICSFVLFLDQ